MTIPRFGSGAKIAERAPMTTSVSPVRIFCHCTFLWLAVRLECITAIRSTRELNRWTVWAVRAISGNMTMAALPPASTASIARMYNSVLPLSVTP